MELVVRSELDGVMNYKGQDQLLSIKALNEFDPKHTGEPHLHIIFALPCCLELSSGWCTLPENACHVLGASACY